MILDGQICKRHWYIKYVNLFIDTVFYIRAIKDNFIHQVENRMVHQSNIYSIYIWVHTLYMTHTQWGYVMYLPGATSGNFENHWLCNIFKSSWHLWNYCHVPDSQHCIWVFPEHSVAWQPFLSTALAGAGLTVRSGSGPCRPSLLRKVDGKGWTTETNGETRIILYKITLFTVSVSLALNKEKHCKWNYMSSCTLEKLCHTAEVHLARVPFVVYQGL